MEKDISGKRNRTSSGNAANNSKVVNRRKGPMVEEEVIGSKNETNPARGDGYSVKNEREANHPASRSTSNHDTATDQESNENCGCHGSCGGRFGCACVAICLVAGCAIFEYFFNHEKYCELAKNNTSMTALVQEYSEKIKALEQRVETLEKGLVQMEGRAGNAFGNKARTKWKVWIALKNKLEEGEAFGEELKAFESTFAYDQDLVNMVKDAIGAAETESQISDDTVVDAVKKYMNKVVSIRKINNSKLLEISGYVITSIEGVTGK